MLTDREREYRAFLRSKVWKEFRAKIIKERGKKCEACGLSVTLRVLHLHHKTYVRFGGKERKSDVVLLCKSCHRLVHKIDKQNGMKDLALVTDLVIAYMKKLVLLKALDN